MPAVVPIATLNGAGTFSTIVLPTLNTALTVIASASCVLSPISIGGYVGISVTDQISGNVLFRGVVLITLADIAGGKSLIASFSYLSAVAASLVVSVFTLNSDDGTKMPVVQSAALASFGAA